MAFPFVLEPSLDLQVQYRLWNVGFAVLVTLTRVIVVGALANVSRASKPGKNPIENDHLTAGRRLRWLALAFAPSSLMLGVTTYITTDVAAVPLLRVIPLALYLLTFVFAFTRRQFLPATLMSRLSRRWW